MREFIERILNEFTAAKQQSLAGHPLGVLFKNDVPHSIYETGIVDPQEYYIDGSVGVGNWATIPWVCIYDRDITLNAKKGVYIAYLLNKSGSCLYLTLSQGATDIRSSRGKREAIQTLQENAADIINRIDSRGFLHDGAISLGDQLPSAAELYAPGVIFYKAYNKGAVPKESELRQDLSNMVAIYREYAGRPARHILGRFASWELLDEYTALKDCDKSVFAHNGSNIARDVCWFFDADHLKQGESLEISLTYKNVCYAARITADSANISRIRIFWSAELGKLFNALRSDTEQKLRFTRLDNRQYSVELLGGEPAMSLSVKEVLEHVKAYISAKGFSFPTGMIENFYLSLKSKPFVILAGTSGTGKTRLVRLFAEAIGAEYKLVPVRPDWSDSSDLFGHVDLNGRFIPGSIIDFILSAQTNPTKPHLLCLDEMNLARVEYYLSDFLSIIETRSLTPDGITSDPLISLEQYGSDDKARTRYGTLCFPQNLYVVGTVNMDETTYPFSKKVLDRANTIEFSFVDLIPPLLTIEPVEPLALPNSFLCTDYLLLNQCMDEAEYVTTLCAELQKINRILAEANAHIGYRVRDEIAFYMVNNKKYELLTYEQALDNELLQKVLPRLQGSSASVRDMLCELFKCCAGDYTNRNGDTDSEKMQKTLEDGSAVYPGSAEKLRLMVKRFEEDGFTSYWL